MVDISEKDDTKRTAVATATITLSKEALEKVKNGQIKKGDVLSVAQVAGIMGAKNTSSNIPMCHQIKLVGCDLEFDLDDSMSAIKIYAISWENWSRNGSFKCMFFSSTYNL